MRDSYEKRHTPIPRTAVVAVDPIRGSEHKSSEWLSYISNGLSGYDGILIIVLKAETSKPY